MTDLSKLPGLPWPLSRVAYRSVAPSAAPAAAPAPASAVASGPATPASGTGVSVEVVGDRLVVAGPRLESVLAAIETHVGCAAELVGCERTITGGIWGFFGREHFVVEALLPERHPAVADDVLVEAAAGAPSAVVAGVPAGVPADASVEPAEALDGPTFADVLERALAELETRPVEDISTGATGTDAAAGQRSSLRRNGLRPPAAVADEFDQGPAEGSPAAPPVQPATGAAPVELLLELLAERAEQLDLADVDPALLDRIVGEIAPTAPTDLPDEPLLVTAPLMVPFDVIAPETGPEAAVESLLMVPFDVIAPETGPETAVESLLMVPFDVIAAEMARETAVDPLLMVPFDVIAADIAADPLQMVPFDVIAAHIAAATLQMVPFDLIAAELAAETAVGAATVELGGISPAAHSPAGVLSISAPAMPFDDVLLAVRELAGEVPCLPDDGIVAVVGDADEAIRTAELLARSAGIDPSEVVVIGSALAHGQSPPVKAQTVEDVLRRRRRGAGRSVTFVAVVLTPGVEGTDQARTALATLRPAQTRLAAPGSSRAEGVTDRLSWFAPVHAIDLVSPTDVDICAGFLDLDVPVGSIDGFTATPESWARWLRSSKPTARARAVGTGAAGRARTAPSAATAAVLPVAAAAPSAAEDRSAAPTTRVAAPVPPLRDIAVTPAIRPAAAAASSIPVRDIVLPEVVDLLSGAVRPLAHHSAPRSRGARVPAGTTNRRRSRSPLHTPTVDLVPRGRAPAGPNPGRMAPTDRAPTDRAPTDRAPSDRALVGSGVTPDHRIVSSPAFPVVESTRRAVTAPDHRNDP